MAKIRVYEVARKFDVSSEAMVNLLREMDIPVKNHMSSIDEEMIDRIRGKFDQEKEAVKHAEEEKKKKLEEAKRARRGEKSRTKTKPETEVATAVQPETVSEEVADAETDDRSTGRRPRRRRRRRKVDQAAVEANIKKTLAKMDGKSTRRRKRVRREESDEPDAVAEPENLIRVTEFVSVGELADLIDVPATKIIQTCMDLGLMVTVNQRLDFDTISLICEEFGYAAQRQDAFVLEEPEEEEVAEENLVSRPPW